MEIICLEENLSFIGISTSQKRIFFSNYCSMHPICFILISVRSLARRARRHSSKSSRRLNLGFLRHPRVTLVGKVGDLGMGMRQGACPSVGRKWPREGVHQRGWGTSASRAHQGWCVMIDGKRGSFWCIESLKG